LCYNRNIKNKKLSMPVKKIKKEKKTETEKTVKIKVRKVKSETNKAKLKAKIKSKVRPKSRVKSEVKIKNKKPKVAIISLTSCEGCQFALLDLGQKFLDFANSIEMIDFRLIEDEKDAGGKLDLVLIEGNPVTSDNLKTLKKARKRSKILVAMGNCAAMGGVPEIKNYHEKTNTIKHVYKYIKGVSNPEIREIDNFVKVDFTLPGCPINPEEFLQYIPELLAGKKPIIADSPVCVECKKAGNRCLLLDGKPCFGPMILGGCGAVCPSSRMMCQGCRGLRPKGNVSAMRTTLKNMITDEEFENISEIYGLRDDIDERSIEMI
jgi:coenzyme F420-reducing hydrogenase gamma subunit